MRSSTILPFLAAAVLSASVGEAQMAYVRRSRATQHPKRDVDYADPAHCPGGSIGDADSCTWEATTIYTTPIQRWIQYGDYYSNCDPNDTAGLTETVTAAVTITDTITDTWGITVGFSGEGVSIGGSFSYAEAWATATTAQQAQALTVGAQQAGNINVYNDFVLAEGHLKINYGSKQDGHYIWLEEGLEVYSLYSNATQYSANVADCGVISKPDANTFYYLTDDYNNVVNGPSSTFTYSDNSK